MSAPPPGWAETVAYTRAAEGPAVVMVPRATLLALADYVEALRDSVIFASELAHLCYADDLGLSHCAVEYCRCPRRPLLPKKGTP